MILSQPNLIRPIIHPGITRLDLNVLLLSLLLSSSAVTAQHRNGTQDDEYGIYTNFDPTIALVIVVLVCAFFLLGVLFMFIRHCSEPDVVANLSAAAAARNFSPHVGLDPAVIEKFPVFFYSEVKNVKIGRETLECAICLSEFDDDETLRLLPKCNHVFHPECIDEWLAYHVTCPVCRGVLAIDSADSPKVSPQETAADFNQDDIVANLSQSSNEIAITVNEEQNQPTIIANMSQTKNRQPRSSISGRFPRSHSTGHSLIQGGENIERYTLRLPEEVRTQIMANAKLKRTLSVNLISTKEWSAMKIERGRQIGWSERWSILINPAFVSKGSSVKSSSKIDNEGDSDPVDEKNLLGAVKLNCLNLRVEGVEEASTGVGGSV